jgi:hypothetical protein
MARDDDDTERARMEKKGSSRIRAKPLLTLMFERRFRVDYNYVSKTSAKTQGPQTYHDQIKQTPSASAQLCLHC